MRFISKHKLLTLACCLSIAFTSCKETNEDEPSNPETPTSEEKVMSISEQKQYLESVGSELIGYFEEKNFDKVVNLLDYSAKTYENYSWDSVSSWASEIYDDLIENLGTTTSETDEYGYTYFYNNYKVLIMASNFHSRFVAQDNKWVRYDSNDLQFQFKDQSNNDCILKLSTSGNIKKVYVGNIDEYDHYDYSYGVYTDYYDRTQLTIGIPEQIILTLTCGGTDLVKGTINIDLASITNDQFDFSKSSINISSTIELYNGYKIELSQASYTPNNLRVDFNLSSNGTSLIKITASSDINDIPSIKLDDFSSDNFDIDEDDFSNSSANNAYASVDILGKVQIQGEISKVNKYIEYLYNAEENSSNEKEFKSYINQANDLSKFYVSYNGSNTIQASIKLEPFNENESGYDYWYYEPVFEFQDGSKYCSIEAFFNDSDFKNIIDTFEQIIEDYSNKFDY